MGCGAVGTTALETLGGLVPHATAPRLQPDTCAWQSVLSSRDGHYDAQPIASACRWPPPGGGPSATAPTIRQGRPLQPPQPLTTSYPRRTERCVVVRTPRDAGGRHARPPPGDAPFDGRKILTRYRYPCLTGLSPARRGRRYRGARVLCVPAFPSLSKRQGEGMTPAELEALNKIRSTDHLLNQWRARCRKVEEPIAGSQLAADDKIWVNYEISQVARSCLASSTQHLNLALTAVKVMDIYPSAHYTVLRGGLVGACQAVWVLGPDDALERQQRGLRLITENYAQALKWVRRGKEAGLVNAPPSEVDHLEDRRRQSRELWRETEGLSKNQELNLTEVISYASTFLLGVGVEAESLNLQWRELSGDAHVLGWSLMTRSDLIARVGGGIGEFAAGGDLQRLAESYMLIFRMLKRGWSLFDQRCEEPVPCGSS